MKIKLAIFDLDGTLLNTIEDLGRACNHALEMCGYPPVDMKEYNTLVGRGIYNLFKGALPEGLRTEKEILRMKSHFIPYYNEHMCDFTKPYDGITEMLGELEENGVRLAIASNKYQDGTVRLVKKYFGDRTFANIIGQRDGMPIKPDPGIIDEIAESYADIAKDEIVYIGDSNVDMETGRNAGVKTVGVTWGFRSREELQAYNPWMLAENPKELTSAILNIL